MHKSFILLSTFTTCLLFLSACGGGGGGGGTGISDTSGNSTPHAESTAAPTSPKPAIVQTPGLPPKQDEEAPGAPPQSQPSPPPDHQEPPPPAPTPTVAAPAHAPANPHFELGIKQLTAHGATVTAASHYELLEDPDGPAAPLPARVVASAPDPLVTAPVSLHRTQAASYALRACNAGGCGPASPSWIPDANHSIGFFSASNASFDARLGTALALSADGSTLVVGAPGESGDAPAPDSAAPPVPPWWGLPDTGAVYVYTRQGGGWVQQAYLKASNVSSKVHTRFGFSVAVSQDGTLLAIGAPGESTYASQGGLITDGGPHQLGAPPASQGSGAVYLFQRSAGKWQQTLHVKATDGHAMAQFGHSVALSAAGDTLAAGAPHQGNAGAVYLLARAGDGAWHFTSSQAPQLRNKASLPAQRGEEFGASLALSGDGRTLAVGAPGHGSHDGAVLSFSRAGNQWQATGTLLPSGGGTGHRFGYRVALSGDGSTLAASAPHEASAGGNSSGSTGSVYLFTHGTTAWQQRAVVKAGKGAAGDLFGHGLALSANGRLLAVGAPQERSPGTGFDAPEAPAQSHGTGNAFCGTPGALGAAYLFTLEGYDWRQSRFIKPSRSQLGMCFGQAMALSADGESLAVGAPLERAPAGPPARGTQSSTAKQETRAGAVYLY